MSRLRSLGRIRDLSVGQLIELGLSEREIARLSLVCAGQADVGMRERARRARERRRGKRAKRRESRRQRVHERRSKRARRGRGRFPDVDENVDYDNLAEPLNRPRLTAPPPEYSPAFSGQSGMRPATWVEGCIGEMLPTVPRSRQWSRPIVLGTTPTDPPGSGNIRLSSRGGTTVVSRTVMPGLHVIAELPTQHLGRIGARFAGASVGYVQLVANLVPLLTSAVDSIVKAVPGPRERARRQAEDDRMQDERARARARARRARQATEVVTDAVVDAVDATAGRWR